MKYTSSNKRSLQNQWLFSLTKTEIFIKQHFSLFEMDIYES